MDKYRNQWYQHMWKKKHAMDHKPILLKWPSNKQKLAKNHKDLISFEIPREDYITKYFISNLVESNTVAPLKKSAMTLVNQWLKSEAL